MPDAFHTSYKTGDTIGTIQWLGPAPPTGKDERWSVLDAHNWLYAYPSDRYAQETILLAHSQLIQKIALQQPGVMVGLEHQGKDTGGAEFFAIGLAAVIDAVQSGLGTLEDFDALGGYLGATARNAMSQARSADEGHLSYEDINAPDESENEIYAPIDNERPDEPLIDSEGWERVKTAVKLHCAEPHDPEIVELSLRRNLSQEDIGKRVGLSRDQVQRRITAILRCIEDTLGLPHAKTSKRRKRRPGEQD